MSTKEKHKLWKKIFLEMKNSCLKYEEFRKKDSSIYNSIDMINAMDRHLYSIELFDKYEIDVPWEKIKTINNVFIRINDYIVIKSMGEKYNSTISCSDDGQPEDEIMLEIYFSTGAYIFGSDYPTDLFQDFLNELKSFKPKYIDSMNTALYFSIENSKDIYNNFSSILEKYNKINKTDFKERKIKKLEEDLSKLKEIT